MGLVRSHAVGLFAYLVSHAITVIDILASLIIVFRLLESRRTTQSVVAWVLALAIMPLFAIPLYLLLGARKFPRRAKGPTTAEALPPSPKELVPSVGGPIARVAEASFVAPARSGNTLELLVTGELAYTRLLDLINRAEHSIDLTIFILGADATGDAIVGALAESAKRGVGVRLIVDAVGSARSRRNVMRVLSAAGAEVRAFMPLWHSPIRGRTNLRSHRKLCVVDGEYVFAGGMNIADEYMGTSEHASVRWRDVAAIARGPVALDAEAIFESDWAFCGGSKRAKTTRRDDHHDDGAARGDAVLQIVPSGPDMTTDTVYDMFLTGIFGARERIAIVTPYYVPDDILQHALILAARRGVRTELVVPSRSNHRIADVARRKLIRELSAAGVIVHYYELGMVHAKAMVIDDVFAYVGSPNFDMRSLFLNYEDALCAYSPNAVAPIRSFIDALIAQCSRTSPAGREHWLLEQLARLVAPEL